MAPLRTALKDSKDRAIYTGGHVPRSLARRLNKIPRHAYFWFLPHVFHRYSTGFPLRLSQACTCVPACRHRWQTRASRLTHKLRQLGDVAGNPSRLILREQLGCRAPPRLNVSKLTSYAAHKRGFELKATDANIRYSPGWILPGSNLKGRP